MATFVLVHGAWSGGWMWRDVAHMLRAAGHEAFTPTLTGLGERVHLARPDVDLDCHVLDVANVLRFERIGRPPAGAGEDRAAHSGGEAVR